MILANQLLIDLIYILMHDSSNLHDRLTQDLYCI